MKREKLLRALTEIGDDLLHMAEYKRFSNPWRKWLTTAACIVLVVSLSTLALPYLPIGCGSSTAPESPAAPGSDMEQAAPEATEDFLEEPAEAPTEMEPPMPEETPDLEAGEGAAVGTDRVVYGGTWYYLDYNVVLPGAKPGNLGELLGEVEDANREDLLGCKVYAVQYATWYGNHAVNGVSVPDQIYVETADGFVYGRTYNEKIVSRYSAEDVEKALDEGDTDWIVTTFVRPLEKWGVTGLVEGNTDREQMNRLFLASLELNTGVPVIDRWMEDQHRLVPAEDLRWRLERFLDEPVYDLEQPFVIFPYEEYQENEVNVSFDRASVEGDTLYLWVNLPETEKFYEIRFDEDSWRYVNIEMPDGEPLE